MQRALDSRKTNRAALAQNQPWSRDYSVYIEAGNRTIVGDSSIFSKPNRIYPSADTQGADPAEGSPCPLERVKAACLLGLRRCQASSPSSYAEICEVSSPGHAEPTQLHLPKVAAAQCFQEHADCYLDSGCTADLIDRDQILVCFNEMKCSMNKCDGMNPTTAATISLVLLAFAPVLAAANF